MYTTDFPNAGNMYRRRAALGKIALGKYQIIMVSYGENSNWYQSLQDFNFLQQKLTLRHSRDDIYNLKLLYSNISFSETLCNIPQHFNCTQHISENKYEHTHTHTHTENLERGMSLLKRRLGEG